MDERVNPKLFRQPEEFALYEAIQEANRRSEELLSKEDYLGYLRMLSEVFLRSVKEREDLWEKNAALNDELGNALYREAWCLKEIERMKKE